jgi:hypothetical protein
MTERSIRMIAETMLSWVRNSEVAWLCYDTLPVGKVCRDNPPSFLVHIFIEQVWESAQWPRIVCSREAKVYVIIHRYKCHCTICYISSLSILSHCWSKIITWSGAGAIWYNYGSHGVTLELSAIVSDDDIWKASSSIQSIDKSVPRCLCNISALNWLY